MTLKSGAKEKIFAINRLHHLKKTMGVEENGSMPSLGMMVIHHNDGQLSTTFGNKPTVADLFMNSHVLAPSK